MANPTQVRKQEVLRFADLLPGLLSISWRLPSIISTMRELLRFSDDSLMSLGTVLERNAVQYEHNTAILYENVRYTHREFNDAANRYAHYLMSQGFKKGDVAVVLVDNRPELLMIVGAISKIGGTSSLINPNHRGPILLHSMNLTRGKFFIVGEELLEAFEEVKPGLQLTREDKLYFQTEQGRNSAPSGYVNFSQVLQGQSAANPPTTGQVRLGDPFAYVFTSGTTGLPKAAIQTHRRWFGCQYWFGKIVMNMKTSDVHYCALPFCHTNALNVSWGATSAKGTALAIRRKFSASHFLEDVRKFKANSFIYIGELCRYLLNQPPKPDDADNPLVSCLGNGLRPEIWKEFKKRFGISKVHELYGAAEGTLIFTNLLNVDCTVGMCLTPFAIVKYDLDADEPIRDEKGFMVRVPPGEKGLILGEVSDSLPFAGYSDKDASQRKLLRNVFKQGDCWFNFGDLVLNQGYKHIQFVDRLGDTYRWKGENVSTTEVESVVNTLPQVSACTAYGVKVPGADGRAGMLAIIPTTGPEDFDLQALTDLLRNTLPSYAVPKFLRLRTDFETTGTHKIKKTSLRDEGFDPDKVADPLYVLLPDATKYQPLTRRVYEEIEGGVHRF